MPAKEVLIFSSHDEQNVSVEIIEDRVCIYNDATDATAWSVNISLADWEAIKFFVNKQLIK